MSLNREWKNFRNTVKETLYRIYIMGLKRKVNHRILIDANPADFRDTAAMCRHSIPKVNFTDPSDLECNQRRIYMKSIKRILATACAVLLVFSLAAASANPALAPFSLRDMAVGYVYAGETPNEVAAVFGEPENSDYVVSEATGEMSEHWYYDGLILTFSGEAKLIGAETGSGAYIGPRGVAVGQTLEDVIGRFYRDLNISDTDVLYTSGYVELMEAQFPPCGYIQRYDDGTFSVLYAAPETPFGDEVLTDPMDFVYEPLATFMVNFNSSGTVTDYSWDLRPWTE
jgi:hypothetical protein